MAKMAVAGRSEKRAGKSLLSRNGRGPERFGALEAAERPFWPLLGALFISPPQPGRGQPARTRSDPLEQRQRRGDHAVVPQHRKTMIFGKTGIRRHRRAIANS